MRVEMTFDDAAIQISGFKRIDIYNVIKKQFFARGLICSSEADILTFTDAGNENDFANIWVILLNLLKTDWFENCASSCIFYDEDEEEDVLSQAWKVKQRLMA